VSWHRPAAGCCARTLARIAPRQVSASALAPPFAASRGTHKKGKLPRFPRGARGAWAPPRASFTASSEIMGPPSAWGQSERTSISRPRRSSGMEKSGLASPLSRLQASPSAGYRNTPTGRVPPFSPEKRKKRHALSAFDTWPPHAGSRRKLLAENPWRSLRPAG